MGERDEENPPRAASLPAGYDDEDPYEGENLAKYPEWWREHVRTFREHGMRPYRPPRFADGELTPVFIEQLENELGVSIRLRTTEAEADEWTLLVDDDPVETIERRRDGDGYTVYEIDSARVERLVRDAAGV